MKTWEYQGEQKTVIELMSLKECTVTEKELTVNLSKKKMSAELAIITKSKFKRRKNSKLYLIHGLELTPHEISDLNCCEVSYWKLMQNLRRGHPIEEAIKKSPKPIERKKFKKCIKTDFTSRLEELGSPYSKAQGGSIKLSSQEISKFPIEQSWEYIAAEKLNILLERLREEIELAKYLNEEDLSR